MSDAELPLTCPSELRRAVARYVAGEISSEIALMHGVLVLRDADALSATLEALARETRASAAVRDLAGLATRHADDLMNAAALVRTGVMELPEHASDGVAFIRNQFDAAVAIAPEASVALYSLGSPELLHKATAEIVSRLEAWRLVRPGAVIFDVGCGIGRLERALASRVAAITGVDVSSGMIAEAERRCADLPNVGFAVCNGHDLAAFRDRCVDLVLAVDSFPYLFAADPAIVARYTADARAMLAPGGALLILNFSYRGNRDADIADVERLARENGFTVERAGTREFELWDGLTFLMRA